MRFDAERSDPAVGACRDPRERLCPYTGERISLTRLFSAEVKEDHILPFAQTLDDSFANRVVVMREANRGKAINALLNYGYAVLRAIVARALRATGLHPGVGIFQRHPSNPMPLADDLMEPFRPTVDLTVTQLVRDDIIEVGPVAKRRLVATLWQDQKTAQGTTPLMTAILRTSQSLADSYQSGIAELLFPFTDLDGDDNVQNAEWLPDHVDDSDVRPASDDESPA